MWNIRIRVLNTCRRQLVANGRLPQAISLASSTTDSDSAPSALLLIVTYTGKATPAVAAITLASVRRVAGSGCCSRSNGSYSPLAAPYPWVQAETIGRAGSFEHRYEGGGEELRVPGLHGDNRTLAV